MCSKCNTPDLIWDKTWYENTGKWRLLDCDTERPHKCHTKKPKINIPKINIPKMTVCRYCNPQTRKKISTTKIDAHIKQEHLGLGFD